MTPKEKAKDLIERYLTLQEIIEWGNDEVKLETTLVYIENQEEYDNYYSNLAKQSALISVNEILNLLNPKSIEYKYWDEVELEIENYD